MTTNTELKRKIAKLYVDSHTPWPEAKAKAWPDVFADDIMQLFSDALKAKELEARIDELEKLTANKKVEGSVINYGAWQTIEERLTQLRTTK